MNLTPEMLTKMLTKGQPEKPDGHEQALEQQRRIRLHSAPKAGLTKKSVSGQLANKATKGYKHGDQAMGNLIDWMRSMLPRDKARVARNLVRHPLDTVSLMGEAYQQLERAFDGIDATEKYDFRGDKTLEDWMNYRAEALGGRDGWRTKGMQVLRSNHNAVMVVDLSQNLNPADTRPAPYWYALELEKVWCYDVANDLGQLEYLVYFSSKQSDEPYKVAYAFDDQFYRVIHVYDNHRTEIVSENAHGLDYCPAHLFWKDTIDEKAPAMRQHPASDYLAALDWYQLSKWFERFGDLFNGWPITTTYQQACNFRTETEYCDDGYLRAAIAGKESYLFDGDDIALCPACKDRNSIGPGTNYEVPLPNQANGNTVMLPAVGITTADVASLQYQTEKVTQQARSIFSGVVGSVFEAINNQAVNEKQVASLFEARKKAIMSVAASFENIQTWTEKTICALRYGSDFRGLEINYGTEFFLFAERDLLTLYLESRNEGVGPALLDELQMLYFRTRHRRQPRALERAKITFNLDPARHVSPDRLERLLSAGAITREDYALKLRMSSLLDRFEREKGSIVDFMPNATLAMRINAIRAALLAYLAEEQPAQDATTLNEPNGNNETDSGGN